MVISAAVFGGAASAFLPRVAHRLAVPSGAPPRSSCADCGTPYPHGADGWVRVGPPCDQTGTHFGGLGSFQDQLEWRWGGLGSGFGRFEHGWGRYGAVPRRCRPACRAIPWRVAAAGATASGLLGATVRVTPLLPVLLLAVVLGVLLAVIDMNCLRLPNPLVAALAFLTVPPLAVLGGPGPIMRGVLAAGMSFLAYATIAISPRGGLGFGDVKLATVLGFVLGFLGWPTLLLGVLAPHLINGPIALFLLSRGRVGRRSALPLGPALLAGALIAIALA